MEDSGGGSDDEDEEDNEENSDNSDDSATSETSTEGKRQKKDVHSVVSPHQDREKERDKGVDREKSCNSSNSKSAASYLPVKRGPGRPPKNPSHPSYMPPIDKQKLQHNKSRLKVGRRPGPKKGQVKVKSDSSSMPHSSQQVTPLGDSTVPVSTPSTSAKSVKKDRENSIKADSIVTMTLNKNNSKQEPRPSNCAAIFKNTTVISGCSAVDNGVYDFPSDDCDSSKELLSNNLPVRTLPAKKYWVPPEFFKPVIDSVVITDVASSEMVVTVRECSFHTGFFN